MSQIVIRGSTPSNKVVLSRLLYKNENKFSVQEDIKSRLLDILNFKGLTPDSKLLFSTLMLKR